MEKNRFVCCFVFNRKGTHVALIKKRKPVKWWGKLNGVGGGIEPKDANEECAMTREFDEEAGIFIPPEAWRKFAVTEIGDSECHWFVHQLQTEQLPALKRAGEQVSWYWIADIEFSDCVSDLCWLLPMAQAWKDDPPYRISRPG